MFNILGAKNALKLLLWISSKVKDSDSSDDLVVVLFYGTYLKFNG